MVTRRLALGGMVTGLFGLKVATAAAGSSGGASPGKPRQSAQWAAGPEGQRRADLGDGLFRNPIMAGDYPDPLVLKDGQDYYMTHSSFDASPGLMIWHSRDW